VTRGSALGKAPRPTNAGQAGHRLRPASSTSARRLATFLQAAFDDVYRVACIYKEKPEQRSQLGNLATRVQDR
jgi:hypothetical protein